MIRGWIVITHKPATVAGVEATFGADFKKNHKPPPPVELWHTLVMFHFGWTDGRVMDRPADSLIAHQRTFSLKVMAAGEPTAEEVRALRVAAAADFHTTAEVFISSADEDVGRIVNAAQCLPFIVELLVDAHAHLHDRAGDETLH